MGAALGTPQPCPPPGPPAPQRPAPPDPRLGCRCLPATEPPFLSWPLVQMGPYGCLRAVRGAGPAWAALAGVLPHPAPTRSSSCHTHVCTRRVRPPAISSPWVPMFVVPAVSQVHACVLACSPHTPAHAALHDPHAVIRSSEARAHVRPTPALTRACAREPSRDTTLPLGTGTAVHTQPACTPCRRVGPGKTLRCCPCWRQCHAAPVGKVSWFSPGMAWPLCHVLPTAGGPLPTRARGPPLRSPPSPHPLPPTPTPSPPSPRGLPFSMPDEREDPDTPRLHLGSKGRRPSVRL